jgi:hypothetical protein
VTSIQGKFIGLSLVILFLGACASTPNAAKVNERLDEKLSQEVQVKDRAGLSAESKDLIENSKGLSVKQKALLLTLRESTQKKLEQMRTESIKLRAVLIQDVLSPKYNHAEVDMIKNRMTRLEQNRVGFIFDTVDKINSILGHDEVDNKDLIYEQMMMTNGQFENL